MIIELPLRVPGHAVAWGYLTDPGSGLPIRRFGRIVTRITKDFPPAAMPAAVPGRLASHVTGLSIAIHPAHQARGALVIQPVYEETGDGRLRGRSVVALRVALHPEDDAKDLPGDGARSCAWAFDWDAWQAHAGGLLQAMAHGLRAERVMASESHASRINAPRLSVDVRRGKPAPDDRSDAVANALLAALACGAQVRLDRRTCPTEAAFLAAAAAALARLPDRAAGHVSIAIGVTRLDPSIAWAWCDDDEGQTLSARDLDHPKRMAGATAPADADCALAGDCLPADRLPAAGLAREVLTATIEDPAIGLLVRAALMDDAPPPGELTPHALGMRIVEWARGAPLSPREAASAVERTGQFQGGADHALIAASGRDAAARTAAAVLAGVRLDTFSLSGLSLAARVHRAAAVAGAPAERLAVVFDRLTDALARQTLAGPCPNAALLDRIAADDGLTAALAAAVEREFPRVSEALLAAGAAARCGAFETDRDRAAWWLARFGPRDARALRGWCAGAAEPSAIAGILSRFAKDGAAPVRPTAVTAMGEQLIGAGRWKTVRDVLAELSALIPDEAPVSPDAVASLAERLRMAAELINALDAHRRPAEAADNRRQG